MNRLPTALLVLLSACAPYEPAPTPMPAPPVEPQQPRATRGVIRGEVRIFNESRASAEPGNVPAFVREVFGQTQRSVDMAPPTARGASDFKRVPPEVRRDGAFELGAFIVGTFEPMDGAVIARLLKTERSVGVVKRRPGPARRWC